jgi:C4-type Zn-finger protein
MVKNDCPECGASSDEREFIDKDIPGAESLRMHYTCKKCGNRIIEEFTLTDVFIDDGR